MPTKLNSFGKQQPYVPAGNGEASGEYGDYASGSNRHFNSFTKEVNVTKKAQQRTYENLKKILDESPDKYDKLYYSKEFYDSAFQRDKNNRSNKNYYLSDERIYSILADSTLNYDEAKKVEQSLVEYFTENNYPYDDEKEINKYIKEAPKFKGYVYRGVTFSQYDDEQFEQFISDFNKKGKTKVIEKLKSWSGDEEVAKAFAERKYYNVVFKMKNKEGVSVQHLSTFGGEDEVIQPKDLKVKVKNVNKITPYYYEIELETIN